MLLGSYISQRYQNPLGATVGEGYEPPDIGVEIEHWPSAITKCSNHSEPSLHPAYIILFPRLRSLKEEDYELKATLGHTQTH